MEQGIIKKVSVGFVVILAISSVFLTSYSADHPKRLWVQHVHREVIHRDNTVVTDHGIWVNAFDGRGLTPFRSNLMGTSSGSSALGIQGNVMDGRFDDKSACNYASASCYFHFPWYFPVADLMRTAVYIPTTRPPEVPKGTEFHMAVTSKPSPATVSNNGSPNTRVIDILLTGPAHMNFIIDDGARGARVISWDLSESDDAMVTPSPVRSQGFFYMSIGFGTCPGNVCSKRVRLLVKGDTEVHLAGYGHYKDVKDEHLVAFIKSMPAWARGAEWTNCPSIMRTVFI
jgi:hypothetical protein